MAFMNKIVQISMLEDMTEVGQGYALGDQGTNCNQ